MYTLQHVFLEILSTFYITFLLVISYLTSQYGVDPRVTRLIDTTDIYILPSMNPDAFELGQRENVNKIDLNRDFPDQFDAPGTEYHHQPETAAVMEFCKKHYFVGSISFHGGDLVVNYPWDGNRQVCVLVFFCFCR